MTTQTQTSADVIAQRNALREQIWAFDEQIAQETCDQKKEQLRAKIKERELKIEELML